MNKKYTPLLALLCMAPISANAGISFLIHSDSNGNLTNGAAWTGDGTVAPDVNTQSSPQNPFIDGFSSGTFTGVPMKTNGSTVDIMITLVPANIALPTSADLTISNWQSNDYVRGMNMENLENVGGFQVTYCFAEGLSPFKGDSRPWGAVVQASTLNASDSFNVTTTVEGIQEVTGTLPALTLANPDFTMAPPLQLDYTPGGTSVTPAANTMNYITTATSVIGTTTSPVTTTSYYGTAGLDTDGDGDIAESIDGNGMLDPEGELFIANKNTITVDSAGGAFSSDTRFGMTFNGKQWDDTLALAQNYAIPEPSALILLGAGVGATLFRRKRKSVQY